MFCFLIELKSDICVSNGESFGSTIDTDISCDKFGLPVIKAKNIKGCLREISEELEDIKAVDEGFTDKVFGVPGDELPSIFQIQNAHPVNYTELINDIRTNNISPDIIKTIYTYTRVQTSIDKETGTAKKETLRSIRVLCRGSVFLCEYSIPDDYAEGIKKCIKALRYIGMNRTRGLGNIRCIIPEQENIVNDNGKNYGSITFTNNDYIEYKIHTLAPVIPALNCNSDCIPAAAITGVCFNTIGKDEMLSILNSGTIFTNAYISDGSNRFCRNPAFMAKQKEADYDNNGLPVYIFDTQLCNNAVPPALAMKNANVFISGEFDSIQSLSVAKEINYHHKQSQENPGIVDGINFYQLSSFSEDQTFMGRIYGTPENLKMIYDSLRPELERNIGYYRSSGYGKCLITLNKQTHIKNKGLLTDEIAVYLQAPAIVYDSMGMPCAKPQVFADYVNSVLVSKFGSSIKRDETQKYIISEMYLNYCDISGYNSTWGMNKPMIRGYGEGTVFVFRLEKTIDISAEKEIFIGERTAEGYGETVIFDYNEIIRKASSPMFISKAAAGDPSHNFKQYCDSPWKLPSEFVAKQEKIRKAVKTAQANYTILMSQAPMNPAAIGRLSLMLKESANYEDFQNCVKQIKDKKKLDKALKWIDLKFNGNDVESDYYKYYLNTLFTQAKYALRRG